MIHNLEDVGAPRPCSGTRLRSASNRWFHELLGLNISWNPLESCARCSGGSCEKELASPLGPADPSPGLGSSFCPRGPCLRTSYVLLGLCLGGVGGLAGECSDAGGSIELASPGPIRSSGHGSDPSPCWPALQLRGDSGPVPGPWVPGPLFQHFLTSPAPLKCLRMQEGASLSGGPGNWPRAPDTV